MAPAALAPLDCADTPNASPAVLELGSSQKVFLAAQALAAFALKLMVETDTGARLELIAQMLDRQNDAMGALAAVLRTELVAIEAEVRDVA
jgi:hypothetical protein